MTMRPALLSAMLTLAACGPSAPLPGVPPSAGPEGEAHAASPTSEGAPGEDPNAPRRPAETPPRHLIANAARPVHPKIEACYNEGLVRTPGLSGRVVVLLGIAADGTVQKAEDFGSTMPDPQVVACVIAALRSVKYPAHPRAYEAGLPFTLVPTGAPPKK